MNRASGTAGSVELLAPGGSMDSIRAAVNAGADAVYAGGRLFGARAFAENPEDEELLEAIDYCHLHGAKLYLTVNTLLKEYELTQMLPEYLAPIYEHGVDAVLVQDFGVFHFLREVFPDLPLHASTQMTITGPDGVRLLQEMGAERVVLSRELSLEEIRSIRTQCNVELETFVHGALCYCYSGKCLMSSLIGGRSGNRGRCAQPCRLPWSLEKKLDARSRQYLLSPKDICTLHLLPDLIDAGIASLKIEGRMKSAEYAAGVTAMYRKYIDLYLEKGREGFQVDEADERLLTELFSRGDFSEGYYQERNGRDMITLEEKSALKGDALRHSQETVQRIREQYVDSGKKIPLSACVTVRSGEPALMKVSAPDGHSCTVTGFVPSPAMNRPADIEMVRKQIGKTGNTDFSFESINIDLEDGLFVQVRDLNELRRSALEGIRNEILAPYRRHSLEGENGFERSEETKSCNDLSAFDGSECTDKPGNGNRSYSPADTGSTDQDSGEKEELISFSPETRMQGLHREETLSRRPGSYIHGLYMGGYRHISHPAVTASVCTMDQLEAVLDDGKAGGVYLDTALCTRQNVHRVIESRKKAYLMLPPIWREDTARIVKDQMEREFGSWSEAMKTYLDGIVVGCYDQLQSLKEANLGNDSDGFEVIADASLYTWNSHARAQLKMLGVTMDTLPYECSMKELQELGCAKSECVIYGYQTLMTSAQCLMKTMELCRKEPGVKYLKDRKGVRFAVRNDCMFCLNTIYNSVPLDLVSLSGQVRQLSPASVRYLFTIETRDETRRILNGKMPDAVTRGHFRKGVE